MLDITSPGRSGAGSNETASLIAHCLGHCRTHHLTPVILALPNPLPEQRLQELLENPEIEGIMCGAGSPSNKRIEHFNVDDYDWKLPDRSAPTIACLGPRSLFSFHMTLAAHRHNVEWLVYTTPIGYRREPVKRFLVARFFEKIFAILRKIVRKVSSVIIRIVHSIKHRLFNRFSRFHALIEPSHAYLMRHIHPAVKRFRLGRVMLRGWDNAITYLLNFRRLRHFEKTLKGAEHPLLERKDLVSGRIVMINTSLTHGGAERQVVNTLLGLVRRGHTDVTLLCDFLHSRPEHDFYLWQLENTPVEAAEIRTSLNIADHDRLAAMAERIEAVVQPLPTAVKDDILYYVCELLLRRPEAVHLWQDATNIKGAVAALLVGIPTIIISMRNMTPNRFAYYLPWMWPGYKILAQHPEVIMLNNSRAGAEDYTQWLGLPENRIQVLYNGIEADNMQPVPVSESTAYRKTLGIPANAPVVGGIFRFYPEKDPLLWVEVMGNVAKAHPDVAFLLIGAGHMLDEMRSRAEALGIADRFYTPGTVKSAALPLSLFDVFLLTSRIEGTPNVVIEAQWLGVPVVATDAGGTAEAVDNSTTGWIVNNRDADALAEHVLFILDHHDWDEAAIAASREFAAKRFGLDRMIAETLRLYGYQRTEGGGQKTENRL